MGAVLAILTDKEIRKEFNQMSWRGFRPGDIENLYEKIIERIRKSQEQLLKQGTEMEEVSA